MKKDCSYQDKLTILQHWKNNYEGIYAELVEITFSRIMLSLLVWFIFMIFSIVSRIFFISDSKLFLYVILFLLFIIAFLTVTRLYIIKKKWECKKQFIENKIQINGGIIVKIDTLSKIIEVIEDDVKSVIGERYLFSYNGNRKDCSRNKVGDRVGIIYGFNGISGVANLFQLNDTISHVFPLPQRKKYISKKEISELQAFPMISCVDLCQTKRKLTEKEFKEIREFQARDFHKGRILLGFMIGFLFLLLSAISIIVWHTYTFLAGSANFLFGSVLLGIFIYYIVRNTNKGKKRMAQLETMLVSEVIYRNTAMRYRASSQLSVFEYKDGSCKTMIYNVLRAYVKVNYGDKLLKLECDKTIYFYYMYDDKVHIAAFCR